MILTRNTSFISSPIIVCLQKLQFLTSKSNVTVAKTNPCSLEKLPTCPEKTLDQIYLLLPSGPQTWERRTEPPTGQGISSHPEPEN